MLVIVFDLHSGLGYLYAFRCLLSGHLAPVIVVDHGCRHHCGRNVGALGALWYLSLTLAEQDELLMSLDVWYERLTARFRPDRSTVLAEADGLMHTFEGEDRLPLQRYVDDNLRLYREAGERDEYSIVRRIHQGLDYRLQPAVTLCPDSSNTLSELKHRLDGQHYSVTPPPQANCLA